MTAQTEHLMELANEIVKLKLENEKLRRQLQNSVSVQVLNALKNDLHNAWAQNRIDKDKIDQLKTQNQRLVNVNNDLGFLYSVNR